MDKHGDNQTAFQLLAEWDRLQLEERWPNPLRVLWAMRLARDLDTCAALLRNEPVDPARIHTDELKQATKKTLVQLVAPIELFEAA